MLKLALPGLAIVVTATSCVPAVERPVVSQDIRPERDPRALLRRLALDVPDDLATLPARLPARSVAAAAPVAAPAFLASARSADDATRAGECLTAAIYYEARSEAVDGQRAVAQVVLNRVRDRAFPASVCGVVYQGSTRRTGCQFSFTCDGSMARARDPRSWEAARAVAEAALAGAVYAPAGSATHYHTTAISPWWAPSLAQIGTIGSHIFYRWRGAMERALTFRQQYAGWEPAIDGGSAPTGVTSVAGVTIHYGTAEGSGSGVTSAAAGVTIHRNALVPPPLAVRRITTSAGVRVHRYARTPGENAAVPGDGATFTDESGAI